MILQVKYGTIKLLEKEWVLPALLFDTDIFERLIMKKKMRAVDLVNQEFHRYNEDHGLIYELVDVEFVKEGRDRFLRIYLDKEGGVDLKDCENFTRFINKALDEKDPIEENYMLEVSSAGIERPLKKLEDFIRFKGRLVQIKLYFPMNSTKILEGIIEDVEGKDIILLQEGFEDGIRIGFDKIAGAKLLFKFA